MNEFEQEDKLLCDQIDISDFIKEQVSKIRNKSISVKKFDKLIENVCKKFDISDNNPLNEYVEDKLMEVLDKNKIKGTL